MTAPATAAAVRAGVAGFAKHPFVVDTAGNRMIVAAAPYLGPDVAGSDRLAELAAPAAVEAVSAFAAAPGGKPPVPVYVGLPPVRPGRGKDLPAVVLSRVRAELAAACPVARVEAIETGHAAGAMAVKAAWEAIRAGAAEFALAGGVDSYFEPETLEWQEANDQVHSAAPENNEYGFIPGEAAGFVLLASEAAARRCDLEGALEIPTVQTTRETKLIKTDSVCLGEGLTGLLRALGAGLSSGERVDHLYCDMNGEPYRAEEFGFATIRAGQLFKDPSAFTTPADCWGDVGAASGPLFLVLAEAATRKGYAPGPVLAAFTSAESGERCGFVARGRAAQGVR
jgi:3-oxoacyl-[acyl-carrier-protein] synthase-1